MGRPEELARLHGDEAAWERFIIDAGHHEDALSVRETELSMPRRVGASEESILAAQSNLANTYQALGRNEEALRMRRDVYSGL